MFDKDGDGELDRDEIEKMVLMATRVVVRKQYNAGKRKVHNKVATGNTEVDIPEELLVKIKEIINEIFDKVDKDGVRILLVPKGWWTSANLPLHYRTGSSPAKSSAWGSPSTTKSAPSSSSFRHREGARTHMQRKRHRMNDDVRRVLGPSIYICVLYYLFVDSPSCQDTHNCAAVLLCANFAPRNGHICNFLRSYCC